ncbi:MAG: ABC transporter ATP-binding protein [Christensenellaceae bacterium]|nr:ABC transporter ATP-binding protein [Christensenellaceae bacterium]
MIAVEARNVMKSIHGHQILNDVSFSANEGDRIGVIGQNGSGKSMLFKALSGLLLPNSGTIKVWGKVVGKNSFPSDFGCLIEHPGMLLQYSGMENLRLLASIQKKCTAEDIAALMLRLGLKPDDRRPVRKYSLGMRQKLGIIQAMMEKPKLVILDEPMNNLDAESIHIVRELIGEMQSTYGITTIISSHNMEDIEELCSSVYKMTDGSLREV